DGGMEGGSVFGAGILVTDTAQTVTIQGNRIGTNPAGTAARPNSTGIEVARFWFDDPQYTPLSPTAEIRGNVVFGNARVGISSFLDDVVVTVQGNVIGTDATGTSAVGNGIGGVSVLNGVVGGVRSIRDTTCVDPCNVISGNGGFGLLGSGMGNFIGT